MNAEPQWKNHVELFHSLSKLKSVKWSKTCKITLYQQNQD